MKVYPQYKVSLACRWFAGTWTTFINMMYIYMPSRGLIKTIDHTDYLPLMLRQSTVNKPLTYCLADISHKCTMVYRNTDKTILFTVTFNCLVMITSNIYIPRSSTVTIAN